MDVLPCQFTIDEEEVIMYLPNALIRSQTIVKRLVTTPSQKQRGSKSPQTRFTEDLSNRQLQAAIQFMGEETIVLSISGVARMNPDSLAEQCFGILGYQEPAYVEQGYRAIMLRDGYTWNQTYKSTLLIVLLAIPPDYSIKPHFG